jgi:hypothetical protein
MKSITIKAPWSWAISHGPKRIENRTWGRSYRGPLAIHAGKGWDWYGGDSPLVWDAWRDAGWDVYRLDPDHPAMTLGAVVAVADLVDICSESASQSMRTEMRCRCGKWAARGQYHWKLANVRPLAEPVPCRGSLGLWTLPDDVEAAVAAQLGEPVNA